MKCALICLEDSAGRYLSIGPSCGATLGQIMNWVSMAPSLVLVLESGFYREMPFLHDPSSQPDFIRIMLLSYLEHNPDGPQEEFFSPQG